MSIEELRDAGWIAMECISGSRAYGLATPESDTDIKGVFVLPQKEFYGLEYTEQISNPSNDIVFYELKRFVDLLSKNNPNLLELLATPEDCVLRKDPRLDQLKPELFLSKICLQSFGKYAMAQIKKARGLKKKIINPMAQERKSVLDFCFVVEGQGALLTEGFLKNKGLKQEDCGLSKISHMHEVYGLYHAPGQAFSGIVSSEQANDISLSSIPKGMEPIAIMSFNKSGYSKYCKDFREYWNWVEKRNEARYENTKAHGKNYDSKNLMHTFRLLNMAQEIALEGVIKVRRPDRDFLLAIKHGEFEYDELLHRAEVKMKDLEEAFSKSHLPEIPDLEKINRQLIKLRLSFMVDS